MKPFLKVLLSLSVLSLFGVKGRSEEISVGAYYYPWYDSDGRHWDSGYHGKSADLTPSLGEYSSRDPKVVSKHIEWTNDLGIDHLICSWWGPQSWEDETLLRHVLPIIEKEDDAPKFCLLYETAGILGLDPEVGIDFDLRGNSRELAEHIHYIARNYFSHPSYLKIDGKPVIYLYLSRTFTGDYANGLENARTVAKSLGYELFLVGDEVYWGAPDKDRIAQFDAITSYNMHGPEAFSDLTDWNEFLSETESVYQQYREVANELKVGFIPGVLPGFDSRDASGDHYPIPRSLTPDLPGNSTLKAFLELAQRQLDPQLKTIAITSFNEWHEGTQMEPRDTELPLKALLEQRLLPGNTD